MAAPEVWKHDAWHLGPGLSQGPSWPAPHACAAPENKLALRAVKDGGARPRHTRRPANAPSAEPTGTAAPTPSQVSAGTAWWDPSSALLLLCGELHAVWPSQPLAISSLGWVHQQFRPAAFCFAYSVFPHRGWVKSTESRPMSAWAWAAGDGAVSIRPSPLLLFLWRKWKWGFLSKSNNCSLSCL